LDSHVDTAEIGLAGQETEVSDKARRRVFTAEYKRRACVFGLAGQLGVLNRA